MPWVYRGDLQVWIGEDEDLELAEMLLDFKEQSRARRLKQEYYANTHDIAPQNNICRTCKKTLKEIHNYRLRCAPTAENPKS